MSPIVGTPAYEAGIMAGDVITKINDEKTEDFTDSDDAVNRIKGKPGEPVRLTVIHRGETQEHELTLVRAKIKVDTVLGDRRNVDGTWDYTLESNPEIGYIRITQFNEPTAEDLKKELKKLFLPCKMLVNRLLKKHNQLRQLLLIRQRIWLKK